MQGLLALGGLIVVAALVLGAKGKVRAFVLLLAGIGFVVGGILLIDLVIFPPEPTSGAQIGLGFFLAFVVGLLSAILPAFAVGFLGRLLYLRLKNRGTCK